MTEKKKRCIWGIILFASIGLNLFLAGALFGQPHHEHDHRSPMTAMTKQLQQLPPEQRAQVQAIFDSYKPKFQAQMKKVMHTRHELEGMLKSDSYNRQAVEVKFDELSDEYRDLHKIGQQMMLDMADKLPPDQRAKLMPQPRWKKPVAEKPAESAPAQ